MNLKFRIRSFIFPAWVYSESHYKISYFFERWDAQYLEEHDREMEQLINGEWTPVIPIITL